MRETIRIGVAIAALVCTQGSGRAERQHPYLSAASVCVDLSVKDDLSGSALTTLRNEATRIWLRHGVELTWIFPAPARCDTVVPVVFDELRVRALAGPTRNALALTEFAGRARTIYVSAVRAFRLAGQTPGRTPAIETVGERDYRQGTLIGRALAHELGHVLLETTAHSASGLMRPVFTAADALSGDTRATELSSVETQRLATRFSLIPLEDPRALAQRGR